MITTALLVSLSQETSTSFTLLSVFDLATCFRLLHSFVYNSQDEKVVEEAVVEEPVFEEKVVPHVYPLVAN